MTNQLIIYRLPIGYSFTSLTSLISYVWNSNSLALAVILPFRCISPQDFMRLFCKQNCLVYTKVCNEIKVPNFWFDFEQGFRNYLTWYKTAWLFPDIEKSNFPWLFPECSNPVKGNNSPAHILTMIANTYLHNKCSSHDNKKHRVMGDTSKNISLPMYFTRVDFIEELHHNKCIEHYTWVNSGLTACRL